ncbi:7TM diverse intracellular signaling domain-containing protein [Ferruginibacter paludis]|uniref:sensor histidine kinase n=1 Tax=Ferruginibacter paludis TaxID=1310417 RepID=UPI0025B39808|nr:ATP-binding protein [Ferruginibacter paludis]MDN3658814.1 7TM diverse intracellular signaling domain-containing protein [Ferruginibacter paludis]
MRRLICIFVFTFSYGCMMGQSLADSLATEVSSFKDACSIKDKCDILIDSDNTAHSGNILQRQWKSMADFKGLKLIPATWINGTVYVKFTLQNSSALNDTVYLYPGNSFRSIKLSKISPAGNFVTLKDESEEDGFQPIFLSPLEKTTYLAELHFSKRKFNSLALQIIQKSYLTKYQKILYTSSYNEMVIGYLLSGLLLMMIFFNGANFSVNGKKEFLYNCFYAICMFILIYFNTYTERRSGVFSSFFMGYLGFAVLVIGTVFYIAFTRKFLNTSVNYPLLNKIFYYEERVLLVLLAIYSYTYFFSGNFRLTSLLENGTKMICLGIGILYVIIGIKQKNRLINYLAIGNAILIFFSIISFLLIIFPVRPAISIFTSALLYYELGIVCELIFFLLGLTYKNRIELIEKIKEQEALKLEAEKQIFESKLAILNAQQDERNRISTDMHDDLGAGVTAIRLFSELAKSRLGKNTIPEIEKISFSANELLNNMNTIIWTMNSSNDSFGNMVAYIRSYALEYFENTGINCSVNIDTNLPEFVVNGEIRRNVFLVVKEALNNILKHAKATEVWLTLKRETDGISFYIQDNGVGIDFENLRRFGNGLKNMKQRMTKSGINFSIENKNGTLVTLYAKLTA